MANYLNYDRFVPSLGDLSHIDKNVITQKVNQSLEIIEKAYYQNPQSSKWCIAFSGGKDSIVLSYMIREYFRTIQPTLMTIPFVGVSEISFTFESARRDTLKSAEQLGMKLELRQGLTWEWLSKPKNHKYVTPPMNIQSNVYSMRQQKTVKNFAKKNDKTGIFYGRRKQENTVPKSLYQLKNGQWQCHPLREWTTEEIWWYIHVNNIFYPELYNTEIGKKEGFTPFLLPPEHFLNHSDKGGVFHAIHQYEDWVVPKMAEFYEPAKNYLDTYC